MIDDFSYTKSALILAQTGHVVYVGWAAAMIGWQLYLGAIFIKVFGFSFTVVRLSTLPIAMLTAFLVQRAFVRSGLNDWNACLGTLALMLSPLTLALTFSFMTDIGGLFCIVLCFYACLRALQAADNSARLGWIVFAALTNAAGGTVRQVAWLGVIVMIPCTCWILRKKPHVVITGTLSCAVAYGFIFWGLRWFAHQPYSQPNVGFAASVNVSGLVHMAGQVVRCFLDIALLLFPLLVLFVFAVPAKSKGLLWSVVGVCGFLLGVSLVIPHRVVSWLAPYLWSYVTEHGLVDGRFWQGSRPVVLSNPVRLGISLVLFATIICFIGVMRSRRPRIKQQGSSALSALPRRELTMLLCPFAAAYFLLLLPQSLHGWIYDRYLLPLMMVGILFLVLYYQEHIRPQLHGWAVLTIALFAAYGVSGMHDVFAMYRAMLGAANELRAAGVPRTAIDGGFDYNGLTQIDQAGHINSPVILTPPGAFLAHKPRVGPCAIQDEMLVPVVQPLYALSFDPNACGGDAGFGPVSYHAWLGQHKVNIYVVRDTQPRN